MMRRDTRPAPSRRIEPEPSSAALHRLHESLAKCELRYRSLIEETGAGVATVDLRGRFVLVNPALCRMVGYEREALLGRAYSDFLHPREKQRIRQLFRNAWKNPRKVVQLEFLALHKDGHAVPCYARPSVVLFKKKILSLSAVITDLTPFKEAENKIKVAHERLKHLISSTTAVFFVCEPHGEFRTTYISDNVQPLTGYTPASFLKSPRFWRDRLHPQDRESVLRHWPAVLQKKLLTSEYRFRHKEGRYIWMREETRLVEDERGRPREIIGFWVDLTLRREAEDLVRAQRDLSLKLSETAGIQETLRLCLSSALEVSGMDRGAIYLFEEATGDLVAAASQGFSPAFMRSYSRFDPDNPLSRLVRSGKDAFQTRGAGDIPMAAADRREGLSSMATLPVSFKGQVIGSLNVSSKKAGHIPDSARLALQAVVGEIGNAIARAKLEDALKISEEKFRTLTENIDLGVYRNTPGDKGRFLEANPAMVRLFGFRSKEEMLAATVASLYENPEERKSFNRRLLEDGFVRNAVLRLRKRDGTTFLGSVSAVAVPGEKGEVSFFDGIIEDITERRRAEEFLRRSEMTHRHLFEQSNDPIILYGLDGLCVGANQKAADMLGLGKADLIGSDFRATIAPQEVPDAEGKLRDLVAGRSLPVYERTARRKDGTEFPVEINVSIVRDPEGRPLFVQSIVRDITDRKRAEDEIRKTLQEKDILLREIHHRVKNNMQIIVSLLRLQSRLVKDEAMQDMFRVSQSRIQSMALIHEKLYQSQDLASVDFGAYIEVLMSYLRTSSEMDTSRVRMEVDVGRVKLDVGRAIPCGLIINELATNALKYAFPLGRQGRISVSMHEGPPGFFSLTVSDDGAGLPEGVNIERPETLGLQIVQDLVLQLGGHLEVEQSGGTTFRVKF